MEECFGWLKTIALLRKVRNVESSRVGWVFTFAAAAYRESTGDDPSEEPRLQPLVCVGTRRIVSSPFPLPPALRGACSLQEPQRMPDRALSA